ncbi:hypothetical protein HQO83_04150 [Rhodococcus fascians]|nr:hypothetical protein [Rhodococcus fascians]
MTAAMITVTNMRGLSIAELDDALVETEEQLRCARHDARPTVDVAGLEEMRRRLLNEFRRRGL